jgi:hypothetical protein
MRKNPHGGPNPCHAGTNYSASALFCAQSLLQSLSHTGT